MFKTKFGIQSSMRAEFQHVSDLSKNGSSFSNSEDVSRKALRKKNDRKTNLKVSVEFPDGASRITYG